MPTPNLLAKAQTWLRPPYDLETQNAVRDLIENQPDALYDAFHRDLHFGTGGMRGIMGPGTNRINRYTLGRATQSLVTYLKAQFPSTPEIKVAIAYDCRHHSPEFAACCARILSANGLKTFLFEDFRPTPELSYAVRHLKCKAGIVITASHNPPAYNGYKVYWEDGAQVVPPHDEGILQSIRQTQMTDVKWTGNPALIQEIGQSLDRAFIRACLQQARYTDRGKKDLKIAFTSLHGTSIKILPQALRAAGFEQLHIVSEQAQPDGDFPTVKSPNPEESAALEKALALAETVRADIIIGTDPDADRIGIGVRDLKGRMQLLNGNQTNTLLTAYLLERWREQGRLDGRQFIASTLVSSDIFYSLAKAYQIPIRVTLTGFKWIAQAIRQAEGQLEFIGGGEESFGFMVGDFVRDKDSVASTLLACEIAALEKARERSIFKRLLDLYQKHGLYQERLYALVKRGAQGSAQIQQLMQRFREKPYTQLDNSPVTRIEDYWKKVMYEPLEQRKTPIADIARSDVLIFYTREGSKVAVRPSGTEPKIKFYFSVKQPLKAAADYEKTRAALEEKIDRILAEMNIEAD